MKPRLHCTNGCVSGLGFVHEPKLALVVLAFTAKDRFQTFDFHPLCCSGALLAGYPVAAVHGGGPAPGRWVIAPGGASCG